MADEESAPGGSLEDDVAAQDSTVPDPTGARQDPGTQDAIDDATEAAKQDIAGALSEDPAAGEQEPEAGSQE